MSERERYTIDLEPVGRRIRITSDETLLEGAQQAGVELSAVCGGEGICGKCRLRVVGGQVSPPTFSDFDFFEEEEIAAGWRLACQCYPESNVKVDVPPSSLATLQRLQLEGHEAVTALDPVVVAVDVQMPVPTPHDLRADTTRLRDALREQGIEDVTIGPALLRCLPTLLRRHAWQVRVALRGQEVVALLPPDAPLLGLAVDIGTTKVAAYLVDLGSGETLARDGVVNPQVAYGEDVVSRIAYANEHEQGRFEMQRRLVASLNELVDRLCQGIDTAQEVPCQRHIVEAVLVGNTAMHHLFAGLPVRQLGQSPYVPAVGEALALPAGELGLALADGAYVYLPPNIAGYVGADHVAMLVAARLGAIAGPAIALDIGTNTEISLAVNGRLITCSCASGPAFEGAHIHDGMRAVPGAIESVEIHDGTVMTKTVGQQRPIGICGSGILDAVAEMVGAGIIDDRGRFQEALSMQDGNGGRFFELVSAAETGHGRAITVTRRDVNEIQLAKGAIRAGIEILLREAGLSYESLERVIIAGAFGTYLDVESAIRIGMFPPLPLSTFHQVGNAAGIGAKELLLSNDARQALVETLSHLHYVELTVHPKFSSSYVEALTF